MEIYDEREDFVQAHIKLAEAFPQVDEQEAGEEAKVEAAEPAADPDVATRERSSGSQPQMPLRGLDDEVIECGQLVWSHDSNTVGKVLFVGEADFCDGDWVGLRLYEKIGKNDGCVENTKYFDCEPGYGLFVRPRRVEQYKPACPGLSQPDKVGFLTKRGHVRKNWLRRWFVLKKPVLMYMEGPRSRSKKGEVVISNLRLAVLDEGKDGREFVFTVEDCTKNKLYYLEAPTARDRDEWVAALQSRSGGADSPAP